MRGEGRREGKVSQGSNKWVWECGSRNTTSPLLHTKSAATSLKCHAVPRTWKSWDSLAHAVNIRFCRYNFVQIGKSNVMPTLRRLQWYP